MQIYTKTEFGLRQNILQNSIKQGKIFIHPTDTIYGIGCDATNTEAIKKIRSIKNRYKRPFSIIVPSKTWIREHCIVEKPAVEWLTKLPGPYTLIFKLKDAKSISPEVNNGLDTIGVRIPNHWISGFVEQLDVPIITTSANKVGQDAMSTIEDLDQDLKGGIDFAIFEGEKEGKPSTIVDLTSLKEPTVTERK